MRYQRLARRTIAAEERAIGEWEKLGDRVERAVVAATERHLAERSNA